MPPFKLAPLLNDRLDWNLLRTFLAIAREQSISRAAARLHLTQPAVSLALRRFEESVGRQLVERRGPRIALTRAGEEVQRIAEDVYGTISRLSQEVEDGAQDVAGVMRLGAISGIDYPAYTAFLADFHRAYPRIDLQIHVMRSADVIASVRQQAVAAGLGQMRVPDKKIEYELFQPQRYALFCGRHHPLFGRHDLTLKDLLDENFVSFISDQVGDQLSPLTFFRDREGFTGRVVASSSSTLEVRRLVFAGYGIGCLPAHIGDAEVALGHFQRLPPEEGIADVPLYAQWSADRKFSAAEAAFLQSLRAFIAAEAAPAGTADSAQ